MGAQVRETHTGLVVLVGDKAYKAKKPVTTDFLDFSTPARREEACQREVTLNRRLAPDSYLGVAHFAGPRGGTAEPVIVMRRYTDSTRLASLVKTGQPVRRISAGSRRPWRGSIVVRLGAERSMHTRLLVPSPRGGSRISPSCKRYADGAISAESVQEVRRLANQFIAGRAELFAQRIADRRIVDGHADLLADDIFCPPEELAILDCLEFDDNLRFVDAIDDAAFLAMDLEFLGRADLGRFFSMSTVGTPTTLRPLR